MRSWKGCRSTALGRRLATLLCLVLLAAILGTARTRAEDNTAAGPSAEAWAKAQIELGNKADFNVRCKTPGLDPRSGEQPAWKDTCRTISGRFVAALLAPADRSAHVPFTGVQIVGARITGDVTLTNVALDRALSLDHCWIGGNVDLDDAHTSSAIRILYSRVDGAFSAEQLRSDLSLELGNSDFEKGFSIADSKIEGYVDLENAKVAKLLNASALRVGSTLFMGSNGGFPRFAEIWLNGAKIGGQLSLAGAVVSGPLLADSIQVGNDLYLKTIVSPGKAPVAASFGGIYMPKATIAGNLDARGAKLGSLNVDADKIAGSVFVTSADIGPATARFAQIGSSFDIAGTVLGGGLDLSGARINGELHLGAVGNQQTLWHRNQDKESDFKLLATHAANLADDDGAWPAQGHLRLDGFTFDRLGSTSGRAPAPLNRETDWWDDWVKRDPVFSRTPYQQLAAAFAAAGDRSAAEDIRFRGRVRERELEPGPLRWFGLLALEYIAGYGIGTYTFRVLYWVIGITFVGGLILRWASPKPEHRIFWCWGASLARLLPVIEINKEFTDFFNDPGRVHLYRWQNAFFSLIALVGWGLGAILIAATAGLIQGQ